VLREASTAEHAPGDAAAGERGEETFSTRAAAGEHGSAEGRALQGQLQGSRAPSTNARWRLLARKGEDDKSGDQPEFLSPVHLNLFSD
jgi:hypothetical protein